MEELKAEAIAKLERHGLDVRGKTPAQIRKLLRLRSKNDIQFKRELACVPIVETRRLEALSGGYPN